MKTNISRVLASLLLATLPAAAMALELVVGQVAPLSGREASQARAYGTGVRLGLDMANRSGKFPGFTFRLAQRDDGGRPIDTVSLTRQLIADDKPLVLAGYFGAANIKELIASGVLADHRIALIGYRAAGLPSDSPYVYNVRASLDEEITKIVEHLTTVGIRRIGLFYEDGPDAPKLLATAGAAASQRGAMLVASAPYAPGTTRVEQAVQILRNGSPQAVIVASTGGAAAAFIESYRVDGSTAAQLFAHSDVDVEQLSQRLSDEQMQGLAIAQVTPSPYTISSRLAKEFRDSANAAGIPESALSFSMMEGYIAASVIAEAVRRQGGHPGAAGMPPALDSIEQLDLGGYIVGFRTNGRNGSRFVNLSIVGRSGRLRQ